MAEKIITVNKENYDQFLDIPQMVISKFNRLKMSDITTTEDFVINIKKDKVIVRHSNVNQLNALVVRLSNAINRPSKLKDMLK